MKKTIIALAVLAAGSASAAEIYNKDGVTVDAHGAVEIQLYQDYEYKNQDKKMDVRLDDGNLNFSTKVEISEDLSALAYFDFDFENGKHENSDLWAGLETGFGTIKAGRTVTNWDDTGIDKSYEVGVTDVETAVKTLGADFSKEELAQVLASPKADGEDVVRYDISENGFHAGIAVDLESKKGDDSHVDLKLGYDIGDASIRGFYEKADLNSISEDATLKAYALEAEYNLDQIGLAAGYYTSKTEIGSDKTGFNTIELAASYKMDATTLAAGVNLVKGKDALKDGKVTNYYVTVTQSLHRNVIAYGEIGVADIEYKSLSDNAVSYVAGMEIKF